MGTSILIVLLGMLVPVLAAAPFYVADRREDLRLEADGAAAALAEEGESAAQPEGDLDEQESVDAPDAVKADDELDSAVRDIPEAREAAEDGELPDLVETVEAPRAVELEQAEVRA